MRTRLGCLFSALLLGLPASGQDLSNALDLLTPIPGVQDPQKDAGVLRSRPTRVDLRLLHNARPGAVLRLRLFADLVVHAKFEELVVEPHIKNAFHWKGSLVGRSDSQFVFTVVDDGFAGWVFPNDPELQSIAIQGAPGMYVVRELNDFVHQGQSIKVQRAGALEPNLACNDDRDKFEVLLVYDRSAVAETGGTSRIRSQCLNGIALSNTCLSGGGLPMRFVTKAIIGLNYTSTQTMGTELTRLRSTTDRILDEVHAWRRTYKADMVHMIIGTRRHSGGGVAYQGCGGMISYKSAFGVTVWKSIAGLTLTHEMGHNCGLGHDPANVKSTCKPARPYGYGFNKKYGERGFPYYQRYFFYTVMSYRPNGCSGLWRCYYTRIPRFSSPIQKFVSSTFGTHIAGTSTQNNRTAIHDVRQTVANWSRQATGGDKPPVITSHPRSRTLCLGYLQPGTIVMSCSATGGTLRYQWRRNGLALSGKTARTLTLGTSISSGHAGSYDCLIRNECGTVVTRRATLSVSGACRTMRRGPTLKGANYGAVIANVGDIDRDGYDDLGIGHPNAQYGTTNAGFVEVISGRTHGRITFWRTSTSPGWQQGAALAGGDVNDDGYSDVVAGAPGYGGGYGTVVWYSRRERKLRRCFNGTRGARVGSALTLAQLDLDSQLDLVVAGGDTLYARSSRSWGGIWPALWTVRPVAGTTIRSLATINDVNGDGFDDILVGLPFDRSSAGRWQLRSGRDGKLLRWGTTGVTGSLTGYALASIPDVDGDRVPEIVVGSPGVSTSRGMIQMFSGRTGRALSYAIGRTAGSRLGYALASAGDVNHDGKPDLWASEIPTSTRAAGRVTLRSGRSLGTVLATRSGSTQRFGAAIAVLDSNGDSRQDIAIGEPDGAVWLFDAAPRSNPPRWRVYGSTCNGSAQRAPRIEHSGNARIGRNANIGLYGTLPNSAGIVRLGLTNAKVPLDGIGMKGCSLWIRHLLNVVRSTGNGRFGISMPLPNDTRLVGLRTYWQGVVLDRSANTLGLTTTNAGELTIGAR